MEVEMYTPSNATNYDFTSFQTGGKIMDKFAEVMLSTLGRIPDRYGAVQKVGVEQLTVTTIFTTIYVFSGTAEELSQLVEKSQSCIDFSYPTVCSSCSSETGWDLCSAFEFIAPSSVLGRFGVSSIEASPLDAPPSVVGRYICMYVYMYVCMYV